MFCLSRIEFEVFMGYVFGKVEVIVGNVILELKRDKRWSCRISEFFEWIRGNEWDFLEIGYGEESGSRMWEIEYVRGRR